MIRKLHVIVLSLLAAAPLIWGADNSIKIGQGKPSMGENL